LQVNGLKKEKVERGGRLPLNPHGCIPEEIDWSYLSGTGESPELCVINGTTLSAVF
jgi:hypothetical protein